ncbi:short-chain dehydrogenase [Parafrankia colletiae]|uniref:Short-chain dehydrogenase n=1 Tax=Parafrankia colletiae TaxID=573497 RepID=A0A1S1R1M0_9ACTN|nr:SDR family NAD(P)-dependent oxidoreductase [Parafrankia colletiae]MCK9904661.1 SDR family NAD(P)-dependent oxidoreductase [Frankia sp. Cpl3]OHV38614.1 short-chain dehydrogenase [Parafrankia colletiae]
MDLEKYGPWALVVGGSEGIGESYARKLAAHGFKLILTARKTGPLQTLADDLRAGGAEVRTLSVDLSEPDALERTRTATDDIEVGLLIYNAGANSVRGDFVELDPAVYRSVIAVNVLGQAEFARHYGALMCERRRGGIILSGSGASFMGAPSLAAYCGSKAFSRVFSEALWIECEKYGVDVLHLSIGFTATPAMARLGYPLDAAQSPDEAAQEALDNIAGGPLWIAGGQSSLETAISRSTVTGRAEAVRAVATPGRF